MKDIWLEYKLISPWRNEKLRVYRSKGLINSAYLNFCDIVPRNVIIIISGILQAYIRPFFNNIRYKKIFFKRSYKILREK